MTDLAIVTEKLTRRFGALTAVDNVDLRVTAGQFFGFLGPNGAGKSTTIKMLTGLLAPTSGRMQLLGLDFSSNTVDVKRQIGVVPEGMGLFGRLTGAYIAVFFLVSQVIALAFFRDTPDYKTLAGGLLIVVGGAVIML